MSAEIILALDVPDRATALPLLDQVDGSVRWVKIGLQMFAALGPDWVREVADLGFRVFLDLKLHDIPHTVARAVASLSSLPIGMLTVHAAGGREMLAAARAEARPDLLLLGVTVLTSMDGRALVEIGVGDPPAVQVARLAGLAISAGFRGLVCSPLEIASLRAMSAEVRLVTPGIRPGGARPDDQKRVLTAAAAAAAGANFLVVGRPILEAPDPGEAVRALQAEAA
ncbi:MAG: orotidine-5'-phosphate decarboxylase [Opitutaceae bacterium]